MKNILLIEDDLSTAIEIEMIIEATGGYSCHRATSLRQADEISRLQTPDLIIADIKLKNDEISLDWLQSKSQIIPTIIITGNYSEAYYDRAQEIKAIAYMMKPLDKVALKFELQKILNRESNEDTPKVLIKDGAKMHIISEDEIIWILTEGNYSTIQTKFKKIVIKASLSKISDQLNNDKFIRVHRSAIIAFDKIRLINSKEDTLVMIDKTNIPIGKTFKPLMKSMLKNIRRLK